MDEVIPGLCYPLFIYLIFSLVGILGILLQGGENSGLMSFLVFVMKCFYTLLINMMCIHDWSSVAWTSSIILVGCTLFLINDPRLGNVNMLGYITALIGGATDYINKVYKAFRYVTAK